MLVTAGRPGDEAPIGAPLFACHQTSEGREQTCAGWLAAVGHHHLGVRIAIAQGRIPAEALDPDAYDVELYRSWDELLAIKLRAPRRQALTRVAATGGQTRPQQPQGGEGAVGS